MTTWLRIGFVDAISHAVSTELAPSLIVDMALRGSPIENFETKYGRESAASLGGNPKTITEWAFDIGGPTHIHMPGEAFHLHGLAVVVPVDQFDVILRVVDDAKIRRFADGGWYYKLKFWIHATVLTVAQYDELLEAMQQRQPAAMKLAADFKRRSAP